MCDVAVDGHELRVGRRFAVAFQRTLRVPENGGNHALPPGFGAFPIRSVRDFAERLPALWQGRHDFFIPMYQREAMWLKFRPKGGTPHAVKVGVGGINAVSGAPWDETLHDRPQDYLVCPNQPWLDGINAEDGCIRQFVATALGSGYSIERQVSGTERTGGIQIVVFEPKPGIFPDQPVAELDVAATERGAFEQTASIEMGLGAGGRIAQKIYPDPHGLDVWDPSSSCAAFVHIVNSEQYRGVTGLEPPPTPVSADAYAACGLPWFALYEEVEEHLPPAAPLAQLKTIGEREDAIDRPGPPIIGLRQPERGPRKG